MSNKKFLDYANLYLVAGKYFIQLRKVSVKKSFTYLVRLPSNETPTTKSCKGISFAGVGRGSYELLIEAYADNIDEADCKLRKCITSANARIIPIPFEVAGALQHTMVMRGRLELEAFMINKSPENLKALLPKVKRYIGDQLTLRSRQAKRLTKLLQKIQKYEDTLDPSLLTSIALEMGHLQISPEQI